MERVSNSGGRPHKPDKLTVYDDYDLSEDRMKVHLEAVNEGARRADILGQLDNEVYTVARAANLTAFEHLRREIADNTRRSIMDFQRHLLVLARKAYPSVPLIELETRILANFVNGRSLPEIRCQVLRDPSGSIKVVLAIARRDEAIHKDYPLAQESTSSTFGCRQVPAAIQDTSIDVFIMGQRKSGDIGT
ncbi:unnamed protein product [Schistocephalus solidus]|uniref:DUF484 family protein n=1 Tax=Schistocephalus solidus TaxID=70667 RepID=A0A183S8F6_SCHSO|nr:unnamed protein product [Schistocephalus solidus]